MSFRLFDLNDPQRLAVTTTEGPLLILAGAGTGKTRVITMRAAYLISRGTDPSCILAVTFTNKAATEMRERLAAMLDPAVAKKIAMSTFHALCVRILRNDIEKLGYKRNFSIYDEGDQAGLVRKIIAKTASRDEKLDPSIAKALISKAKNAGSTGPKDEQTLIGAVFARYQAELKQLNALDFDDLLLLTVKLLAEFEEVRVKWQNRFRYLMIDEFQDTNRLQLEMVTCLGKRDDGARPNVAVVGDDDQLIYGWRGAEVSNILEFERHFPNPVIVKLEQNYRSTSHILESANALIKRNPRRRSKHLWSANGDGEKIRLVQAPDDRQEAEFVANEVRDRHLGESIAYESFAVIFRMNAQSKLLEDNFRALEIPYRLVGGKSFYDRREVKDVLAYAACILNGDDDVSLLRIINTPPRGISPATVERALDLSIRRRCSLFQGLQLAELREAVSPRAAAAIGQFAAKLDAWETRLNEPLVDQAAVLRSIIEESGYYEELRRSCKSAEEAQKRESGIREIMEGFKRFQGRSTEGLRGYLDELALRQEREEDDKEKEQGTGVMLITMHAAKGLEFPHVYLVGLEEGILPHDRSKTEGTLDEERRLLYVGITRAKLTLTMSYCFNRFKYGSVAPCTPSSFIKELDPAHMERIDLKKLLSTPVEAPVAKARFAALKAAVERR